MRIIEETEVHAAVSAGTARQAVHDAFCALADGKVVAPSEFAMKLDNGGELHIKGAYNGGATLAFKVATGQFPSGKNSGFTSVVDATTGQPIAILNDGGWLTEMRTAAASAVTARALARPESSTLAIMGAGFQAGFQVAAMREAFELDVVNVWSRTSDSAERFAAAHDANAMASISDAVAGADLVVCCTPSTEPLLAADMIRAGTHVVSVGADMVGKRELAADLLDAAQVLVCDSVEVSAHVGELQHAAQHVDRAVNLGDVLTGRAPGRTASDQITVADLCGLGIQDAAMAELVMGT